MPGKGKGPGKRKGRERVRWHDVHELAAHKGPAGWPRVVPDGVEGAAAAAGAASGAAAANGASASDGPSAAAGVAPSFYRARGGGALVPLYEVFQVADACFPGVPREVLGAAKKTTRRAFENLGADGDTLRALCDIRRPPGAKTRTKVLIAPSVALPRVLEVLAASVRRRMVGAPVGGPGCVPTPNPNSPTPP